MLARWPFPDERSTFVVALAVVTAIAVLNLVVGDRAVLVELLIAGPLLAAAGTSPERTAVVALYALVLSLPLGLAGDAFGSLQHLVGVAAVATGGVLAVALAQLRARREGMLAREQGALLQATRARDELEAMLSGIADAVTGQAPDGSLIYANDAALETLGFASREEMMATEPREILARYDLYEESGAPFPAERLPGRLALAGEGGGEAIIRFRVRATGEERWSVVKSTPVYDGDGFLQMAINVIEDITAHKRSELAERFMSESSRLLASSLDPDEILEQVATLAVPEVADWCAVDLLRVDGELERVALAHADPEMLEKGLEVSRLYPPRSGQSTGPAHVVRSGRSDIAEEVPVELLRRVTEDEHHLELVLELGMRSAMTVPMTARGDTVGAMTFVTGPSGRRFDQRDLELAEELARRCATAVENARLYGERAYIARTPPGEPPPLGAAGDSRYRDCRALPPHRRGQRDGRGLLRPLSQRSPRLDRGDRRCVRQGPGRRGRDGARPLHAAGGGDAGAPSEPRSPRAERGVAAPACRPALLHGRLRLPRVHGGRRAPGLRQRRPPAAPAGAL